MNEDDVCGRTYANALTEMALIDEALAEKNGKGFSNAEECREFAHQCHIDELVFMQNHGTFRSVLEKGDTVVQTEWKKTFKNLLFWYATDEDGKKTKRRYWVPDLYSSRRDAKVPSEREVGHRRPLFTRNYFVPTRYYDPSIGCFNTAVPFPTFAEETGADTWFIYELLRHTCGENYYHVLSWLRQKMLNPTKKTEVAIIFTGAEGTGKSTFGHALCAAMFGQPNVIVSYQFDGSSRFNADYADALVVSIEEKMQDDKRNNLAMMKSMTTATDVRKEFKGVDPSYQTSFTEYVVTTNDPVPLKLDSLENRRFMIMETDPNFTRTKSELADEVFKNIYGEDNPLVSNHKVMKQFKHELLNMTDLPDCRDFVKTDAYKRCFNLPRTSETVEIEALIKNIAPFALESLKQNRLVLEMETETGVETIDGTTDFSSAIMFIKGRAPNPARVAVNRLMVFTDQFGKCMSHASIDKVAHELRNSNYLKDMGLTIMLDTQPPSNGGFKGMIGKYKHSPAMYFALDMKTKLILATDHLKKKEKIIDDAEQVKAVRYTQRFSDGDYLLDDNGVLETVNPLKPGSTKAATKNVDSMHYFMFESDETSNATLIEEAQLIAEGARNAEDVYKTRLKTQRIEGNRLVKAGIACRLVYSGAKSIHILVKIEDAPSNKEEYAWLDAYLRKHLSTVLRFDMTKTGPARLTRAPVDAIRKTERDGVVLTGTQRLLVDTPDNVYKLAWRPLYRQWLGHKLEWFEIRGKRMLPCKSLYRDAAEALLEGSFFTSPIWNGNRNATFFAAYRLCRAMGFSKEELWNHINEELKGYYKQGEVGYWSSREHCQLINQIEEDYE